MSTLSKEEKRIMTIFEDLLPMLTEREKDRLLWICEGILLKEERLIEQNVP